MTRALRHSQLACFLLACALGGCSGTSTGNPLDGDLGGGNAYDKDSGTEEGMGTIDNNGSEVAAGCEMKGEEDVARDEVTALGFAAQDVLALAQGEHELPMVWLPNETVEVKPTGESTVHIEVTPKAGSARLVDYEPKAASGGIEIGLPECPDRLEMDVAVKITSDDGGLDEQLDAVLSTSDARQVQLGATILAKDIGGSLEVISKLNLAMFKLDSIRVTTSFSAFGVMGAISPALSSVDTGDDTDNKPVGGSVGLAGGFIARWPASEACDVQLGDVGYPLALDAAIGGGSVQDAIDAVNASEALGLRWEQAGTTSEITLRFTPEADEACAHFNLFDTGTTLGDAAVDVRGTLKATSEDGRVDGEWEVVLRASFPAAPGDEPKLTGVRVLGDPNGSVIGGLVEVDDFETRYGVNDVELAGYDQANLLIDLSWSLEGSAFEAQGTVTVQGANLPECAMTEPLPMPADGGDPESGGGTGGCPGIDFVEVETLVVSE